MKKFKFNLTNSHKFILLGAALVANTSPSRDIIIDVPINEDNGIGYEPQVQKTVVNPYYGSALYAITVPEVQEELSNAGYITVGQDMIPKLTNKGWNVVNNMLNPVIHTKICIPHKPHHFDQINDGHLLQLPMNTVNAVKNRAKRSARFCEKVVGSTELQKTKSNLEFLIPESV